MGRDSSVGIATRYGLDDPGIEFWRGQDFLHPSRPALGPTQPHTMGTGFLPGVKRPGRGVDHPSPSSAEVKERVELYLYIFAFDYFPYTADKVRHKALQCVSV
jgi:hypothetical protein